MADFKATAKLGNIEVKEILECSFSLTRDVNSEGQPTSDVYGGRIRLKIRSSENTGIIEAMLQETKYFDGTITFPKYEGDGKMKELKFTKGQIVQYDETWIKDGNNPMLMDFTISAEKIGIGQAELVNEWTTH